ncbi:MAG: hypothetical protein M1548_10235 [Actinobacteria bacterium]|nr:hypothetical protein [Actinomycetota bacterium]
MKRKYMTLVAAASSIAIVIGSVSPAFATTRVRKTPANPGGTASDTGTARSTAKEEARQQAKEEARRQAMEKARKMGLEMIDRRIRELDELLRKVRTMAKITEEERAYLVNEIQNNLDSLSSLRRKIEQETDPQALKTEIKSIVTNYRVYMVVLPKVRALEVADRANWGVQRFDALAARIQERVDKAKAAGKDVTKVQELLDKLRAKIAEAKVQIDKARAAFNSMLPVDPASAKSSLETGKSYLKAARQDFKDAIAIMRQIIEAFKAVKAPDDTGTARN